MIPKRRLLFAIVAAGVVAGATLTLASAATSPGSEAAGNWQPAGTVPCGTDWPNPACDLAGSRHSPLTQITPANVNGLKVAWQQSYNGPSWNGNTESQPIVVSGAHKNLPLDSGTMFLDIQGGLLALDPQNGKILWRFTGPQVDNLTGVSAPSFRDRVAYGNGMLFDVQLDRSLVALDAKTGNVIWTNQLSSVGTFPDSHQNGPGFAMFYNDGKDGIVISANNSGDGPLRGHEDAFDAKTGKLLWRHWNTPDPTEFPAILSWGGAANAAYGGVAIWTPPAFDPKLGLMYIGTGNAYPETGRAPGESLWSDSIVAMSIKTGVMKWYFQTTHHDEYDYDCPTPPVLMNTLIAGKIQKLIAVGCKNGYVYVLNRVNGSKIPAFPIPETPVPDLNGGKGAALNTAWPTQPIPTGGVAQLGIHCPTAAEVVTVFPSYPVAPNGTPMVPTCPYASPTNTQYYMWADGTDYQEMSYDPATNYLIITSRSRIRGYENLSPTDYHQSVISGLQEGWIGSTSAINMRTNTLAWQDKYTGPDGVGYSGVVTTASGLSFTGSQGYAAGTPGRHGGTVYAYDTKTGKELWSWVAPDVIYSSPITYQVNGKQYVAIMVNGPVNSGQRDLMTVFSL
jgi:glucose dehydrogenase